MVDRKELLKDLQGLARALQDDLRTRCEDEAEVGEGVRQRWTAASDAGRTGLSWTDWSEGYLAEVAAAWVLASVFVRFLEDNGLIEAPRLSGPGDHLKRAKDERTLYFRKHPDHNDRDYLMSVFDEVATLPGMRALLGRDSNLLWTLGPSAEMSMKLIQVWWEDVGTGAIPHDFTDESWDTRFLGDLYQDLSAHAKKRYALLQTPDFIESFILDRTLTPAIEEFGYREVSLIDPACGSGHFLLGAFRRLFELHRTHEPAANESGLAQRVLDQVAGVDVNPFAVGIARFRLLLAAMEVSGVRRLKDAPAFTMKVAVGDSLLHGPQGRQGHFEGRDPFGHLYATEHQEELRAILHRRYHAVVGNPPYITVKDPVLNQAYRERFKSCSGKYALAVPFKEAMFGLAAASDGASGHGAGFVGMITANSFMKREFGKQVITRFFPGWDVSHVIDTSGAYIPGHGTPTVILLGRNRRPVASTVRAVLGIRGEPEAPVDPARGRVWSEIAGHVDEAGFEGEYVSVVDAPRERFHSHPWSLGGGGCAHLVEHLQSADHQDLALYVEAIGRTTHTGEDNVFYLDNRTPARIGLGDQVVPLVVGEDIRDHRLESPRVTVFPYDRTSGERLNNLSDALLGHFWFYRTLLRARRDYGQTIEERGLVWWEHSMFFPVRYRTPLSIAFAFVATHNHFVLDRGGKVFNRSAPVIKLPPGASEDDHLALLGPLNSSTGCFWMKQVFFCKGSTVDTRGARQTTVPFEDFWEHDGTKLKSFPLPADRSLPRARRLDELAQELAAVDPATLCESQVPTASLLAGAEREAVRIRRLMIAHQEELDWEMYRAYGLIDEDLHGPLEETPPIDLGERAFEIVMARKMASGDLETTWFERHSSTPRTRLPEHWPKPYRRLVERRIELIGTSKNIRLIERPEYKRRWSQEPWKKRVAEALRTWLLGRLEEKRYWPEPELITVARLADMAHADPEFMAVAALHAGREDFELTDLVRKLVEEEAVPYLAAFRYKPSGLRKRAAWEKTWELQRQEDAIEARTRLPSDHPEHVPPESLAQVQKAEVGEVPVPPKYATKDFARPSYWRLRGKLDVPKERFIVYPLAERGADPTPVIGWAGWDHLERAQALASYYLEMKEQEGWEPDRLVPLLSGLMELLPWLRQWHDDIDPTYGLGMGQYFADFIDTERRALGVSESDLTEWEAPAASTRRRRKRGKRQEAGP